MIAPPADLRLSGIKHYARSKNAVCRIYQSLPVRLLRPLRFALVGGTCGTLQLGTLVALRLLGAPGLAANIVAFLCSAQVNFILSNRFIWKERRNGANGMRTLVERWWRFHLSIAGTFVLSQAIFLVGRMAVPEVIASALGMSISAAVNFLIQDRYTFVLGQSARASPHQ